MPSTYGTGLYLRLAWNEETPPVIICLKRRSWRLGAVGGVAGVGDPPLICSAYARRKHTKRTYETVAGRGIGRARDRGTVEAGAPDLSELAVEAAAHRVSIC